MKVPDARQPEAIRALPRCQRRPGAARSTRETNFTPRRFPPSPERMSVSLVAFERVNRVTQAPLGSAPAWPFRLWCGACAQGRACEESPAADLLGPRGTRCGLARQARSGGSTRESRSRVLPKQDHAWRGGPQAFIGTSPLSQASPEGASRGLTDVVRLPEYTSGRRPPPRADRRIQPGVLPPALSERPSRCSQRRPPPP